MTQQELKEVDVLLQELDKLLKPTVRAWHPSLLSQGMPQEIQEIESKLLVYVKPMFEEIRRLEQQNNRLVGMLEELQEGGVL